MIHGCIPYDSPFVHIERKLYDLYLHGRGVPQNKKLMDRLSIKRQNSQMMHLPAIVDSM